MFILKQFGRRAVFFTIFSLSSLLLTAQAREGDALAQADSLRIIGTSGDLQKALGLYLVNFNGLPPVDSSRIPGLIGPLSRCLDVAMRLDSLPDAEKIVNYINQNRQVLFVNGLNTIDVLRYLKNEAGYYFRRKNYQRAYTISLDAYTRLTAGSKIPGRVQASILTDLGDYQNSLGLHGETVNEVESFLLLHQDLQVTDLIPLLRVLGEAYGKLGANAKSLQTFRQQYELATASDLYPPGDLASIAMNLGITLKNCHLPDSSIKLFNYAEKLLLEDTETDLSTLSSLYQNMGNTFLIKNDPAQALNYYERALKGFNKTSDTFSDSQSKLLFNIGACYLSLDSITAAKEFLSKSINQRQNYLQQHHISLAETFFALANVGIKTSQKDSALNYFLLGFSALDNYFLKNLPNLSISEKIDLGVKLNQYISEFLQFYHEYKDKTEFLDRMIISIILNYNNSIFLYTQHSSKDSDQIYRLRGKLLQLDPADPQRSMIIQQIENLERTKSGNLARFTLDLVQFTRLTQIQKALSAEDEVIQFFSVSLAMQVPQHYLINISRTKTKIHLIGARDANFNSNIARILCEILAGSTSPKVKVIFGPSMPMISLEGLRLPCQNSDYLMDVAEVQYFLHVKDMFTTVKRPKLKIAHFFGNTGPQDEFTELPAAAQELKNISKLLSKSDWMVSTHTKNQFSAQNLFRENLKGLLHFANHSLIEHRQQNICALRIPYEDIKMVTGRVENGMDEEGVITAYQISGLQLDSVDLVVLSSCKSGVTHQQENHQVFSLAGAFKHAGSQQVLASLWDVSDLATSELMGLFYQNLLSGQTYQQALFSAKRQLREKYPEPEYWAGFILFGVNHPVHYGGLWFFIIAALLGISSIFIYFRKKIFFKIPKKRI